MEKDYIIARIKDASGENFDKFEHTIIGLPEYSYFNDIEISSYLVGSSKLAFGKSAELKVNSE